MDAGSERGHVVGERGRAPHRVGAVEARTGLAGRRLERAPLKQLSTESGSRASEAGGSASSNGALPGRVDGQAAPALVWSDGWDQDPTIYAPEAA